MTATPRFASLDDYRACLGDVSFWQPSLACVLERHGRESIGPRAGVGATYPTFVCGDVVVKLFGCWGPWRQAFAAERHVLRKLEDDPAIRAPRLLADGQLDADGDAPWPYLITTRSAGIAWAEAVVTEVERLSIASELGRAIGRLHRLQPSGAATHADWSMVDITDAARQSSLPVQLVDEVAGFVAALGPPDPVLVHGDLMGRHVFVEGGRLAGIIDWGDAMVTDRHYEFAKLHLDLFDGDKALLAAFLDASNWPIEADFPRRALGMALYRQAYGLAQHHSMDVFYKLPERLRGQEFDTLDSLARELFAP